MEEFEMEMDGIAGFAGELPEGMNLLDFCKSAIKRQVENYGAHLPTVVAVRKQEVSIIVMEFRRAGDKQLMEHLLLTAAKEADELAFVSECWMNTELTKEQVENWQEGSLENKPGTTEVISMNIATPLKERWFYVPLIRNGDQVSLGEWVEQKEGELSGRFANIFQRARQHERN